MMGRRFTFMIAALIASTCLTYTACTFTGEDGAAVAHEDTSNRATNVAWGGPVGSLRIGMSVENRNVEFGGPLLVTLYVKNVGDADVSIADHEGGIDSLMSIGLWDLRFKPANGSQMWFAFDPGWSLDDPTPSTHLTLKPAESKSWRLKIDDTRWRFRSRKFDGVNVDWLPSGSYLMSATFKPNQMKKDRKDLVVVVVESSKVELDFAADDNQAEEFAKEVDRVRDMMGDPLVDIRSETAGLRYWAVYNMNPDKEPEYERVLAGVLDDEVRWVRYAAAVQLGKAGKQTDKVAPIVVEALHSGDTTFHLWGTREAKLTLHKVGVLALPHLAAAIDHPDERFRTNGCRVLSDLAYVVKDRQHFQAPLAVINAAIAGNKYPTSRPMYATVRLQIDGDRARAEKLLRESATSADSAVRAAALDEFNRFASDSVPDWIVPLLVERLSDEETPVVRAAIGALWSLHRIHDDLDLSASVPVIERRLKEQELHYALRDLMRRFLREAKLGTRETP